MEKQFCERGLVKLKVLGDIYVDRALRNLEDFNPDFQRLAAKYWGDEALSPNPSKVGAA